MKKAADNAFDQTGNGMGGVTVANLLDADTILLGIKCQGDKGTGVEESSRSRQGVDGDIVGPQGDHREPKQAGIGRVEQKKKASHIKLEAARDSGSPAVVAIVEAWWRMEMGMGSTRTGAASLLA